MLKCGDKEVITVNLICLILITGIVSFIWYTADIERIYPEATIHDVRFYGGFDDELYVWIYCVAAKIGYVYGKHVWEDSGRFCSQNNATVNAAASDVGQLNGYKYYIDYGDNLRDGDFVFWMQFLCFWFAVAALFLVFIIYKEVQLYYKELEKAKAKVEAEAKAKTETKIKATEKVNKVVAQQKYGSTALSVDSIKIDV